MGWAVSTGCESGWLRGPNREAGWRHRVHLQAHDWRSYLGVRAIAFADSLKKERRWQGFDELGGGHCSSEALGTCIEAQPRSRARN